MDTFNIHQYHRVWGKRARNLRKASVKTTSQAARLLVAEAKRRAPRKTGDTIRGIRSRKTKNGHVVESWVPGRFKQNLWANRSPPFGAPRMVWNNRKPTVYGDGSHHTTGTPGFFTVATNVVRKRFPKIANRNTRKALRVGL